MLDWEFVIVDKSYKVSDGVLNGLVPCHSNILLSLHAVPDRNRRACGKFQYHGFGRAQTVIVGNNYRIREQPSRILPAEFLQQPFERLRPLVSTDAYANMRSEERRVGKECRSRWARYH